MKKNTLLPLLTILLSGCINITFSSSSSSSSITSSSSTSSTIIRDTNEYGEELLDGYYKATTQTIDLHDVRKTYVFNDLSSIGDVNILVVPVKFKDSNYVETKYGSYEKMKEDIEIAFFGEANQTGWESLTSYYEKSSYNKLHINGEVTDWFELDLTFKETSELSYREYADPTNYIVRQIDTWYKENYGNTQKFDKDKDGYIDCVWMVYDAPNKNEHGIDWAYTTWDYYKTDEPSVDSPIPYAYAWASVDFLYTGKYVDENNNPLVDTHTMIHETGHVLGLEDYYDYDNVFGTAGGLDMMDHNIGDHTAYSKYCLGWIEPYVVYDNCEITIKSFEKSGDSILIKDDWNHSPFDEYLLIEFYTPTGLNELDSLEQYAGIYPKMFQKPGIKIYHIDSRLGYYEGYSFKHYTDILDENDDGLATSTQLAHSNTTSQSCDKDYKLVRLLERGGTNFLNSKSVSAKDSMLFREGDVFDPIDFEMVFDKEEYFNDGEYINYLIEIVKITDEEATLKFTVIDEELK